MNYCQCVRLLNLVRSTPNLPVEGLTPLERENQASDQDEVAELTRKENQVMNSL